MFRHSSYASNWCNIFHVKSLDTAVVEYAPNLNHTFRVSSNEGILIRKCINSYKWMFMSIKLHDSFLKVWIPNKNFEVKTTTHYNFVFFTVRHFSHCFVMALQYLRWLLCEVFKKFIRQILHTEILLNCLLFFCFFLVRIIIFLNFNLRLRLWFLYWYWQVPQPYFVIIASRSNLVYIFQVNKAQNDITYEPRGFLTNVINVVFFLFIFYTCCLWFAILVLHLGILIFLCCLVFLQLSLCKLSTKKSIEIPRKNRTIYTCTKKNILVRSLHI